MIVVPGEDVMLGLDEDEGRTRHEVACMFAGGLVMGTLSLAEGVRVSDELMGSQEFSQSTIAPWASMRRQTRVMEAEKLVFVHAAEIFGVAELDSE